MLKLGRQLQVGSTARGSKRIVEQARLQSAMQETAFGGMQAGLNTLPTSSTVGGTAPPGLLEDLLQDFLPHSETIRRRIYREMYYNDPIIGSGIDMLSTFPFSDFHLTGIQDETKLRKFHQSVNMLDIKTLLPILSTNYLVLGKFVGQFHWNRQEKIFDALIPHNLDFCSFENIGIYGVDPAVTVTLPEEILKLLAGGRGGKANPQLMENINRIPRELLSGMARKGGITIDSDSLLYVARPGMVSDDGVSLLQRCLPIYLMEKALIRGTLDQVWKRQRGILHASIGGDDWEPTPGDFQYVNDLLLNADHDPTGAVITTRNGVMLEEIRRGDDFWRYDSFWDFASQAKLLAMGISQSFVTGDATIATMEGAVNVTLQYFKSYRDMITKAIFYDKVFPTIAVANNYRLTAGKMVLGADGQEYAKREWFDPIRRNPFTGDLIAEVSGSGVNIANTDTSKYQQPRVVWANTLDQNTDSKLMEAIKLAEDHGVPIPLRTYIGAAGESVESLAEQRDADIAQRKFFADWRKEANKYNPVNPDDPNNPMNGSGSGDVEGTDSDGFEASALARSLLERGGVINNRGTNALPGEGGISRIGVLNRDYGNDADPRRLTHKGTTGILSTRGKRDVNDKMNKRIVETSSAARREFVAREKAAAPEPTKKYYVLGKPSRK